MMSESTHPGTLRRLAALAAATLLVALAAPACQSADEASTARHEPASHGVPADGEELMSVSEEVKVGGCTCPTKGNCAALSYSDKPANGVYYITTYGGGNETQKQACAGAALADGTWAYIADLARFGCGAKVKISANGKSCISQVADCGPNKCVEDAAAYNSCNSHFPIIDASPFITKHLFGTSGAGWSDKLKVTATVVSGSATVGCPGDESGGGGDGEGGSGSGEGGSGSSSGGAGGSSSGGKGGSAGAGGAKKCEKDSDCGGGADAKCDKSTEEWRCVNRKELGQSCGNDKECSGEIEGTQRVCEGGICASGCHQDVDCEKGGVCEIAAGKKLGSCKKSGCVLDYPSVSILGIPAPARFTQSYRTRGCTGAPSCVIDINNIVDAKSRKKLSFKTVKLAEHFSLSELSWQSAGSSPYVYVDPSFVKHLEDTRVGYGSAIHVNSGFRSPIHQNKVCMGVCGASYCSGSCAKCSDHMGGQAADLKHSSPKCALARKGCNPGQMHLIFNELAGGDHLHLDTGSGNGTCTYKAISCK